MSYINGYRYKPEAIIRLVGGEDPDRTLTFGVEDEIDSAAGRQHGDREELAEKVFRMGDGRVYLKRDGSLQDGFEIVTHPGSLRHHMTEMHWSGICNKVCKSGYRSHMAGTAGLHVHVGRKQLGRTDAERNECIQKITCIVHLGWDELHKLSRRKHTYNDARPNDGDIRWGKPMQEVRDAVRGGYLTEEWARANIRTRNIHDNRYFVINCENAATVEFRVFRGSAKRDTVIATLQLVSNICEYARDHSWDECLSADFLRDVCGYRQYNELNAYLYHRELVNVLVLPYRTSRIPEFKGPDGSAGRETNPRRARPDENEPA